MSFARRFAFNPGAAVISQIEGVVIIRQTPPSPITGVIEGVVGMVGEFQDSTYGISVSPAGQIGGNPRAVRILTSSDQITYLGGFDETIGEFGISMGNGFVELASKSFTGLVVVPVDNLSPTTSGQFSSGVRMWRDLPTCISATNPNPIVPVSAALIPAGLQFQDGSAHRARVAGAFTFGGQQAYETGTDGAITLTGTPAASQTFTSAGGSFITKGVKVGDILVLGVIGGAGALGSNAGTYRVTAVTDATDLVVEKLNGATFDWVSGTAQPWRLHVAAAADSSGTANLHLALVQTGGAGYLIPMRPLDASIAIDAAITPTVPSAAGTASSWNPTSGLTGRTNHITGDSGGNHSIIYDAAITGPNVAASAALDARYVAAISAMRQVQPPASLIDIVVSARKSSTIRNTISSHCQTATAQGLTRRGVNSPALSVQTTQAAIANTDPGVGVNRTERLDYSWPGCVVYIPQAVGFPLNGADGSTVLDGTLDTTFDTWLASIESNVPPENNPGQVAPPVPQVLAPVLGYQRATPQLQLQVEDYIALKAAGVAALFMDPDTGPQIESGVTTSLNAAELTIQRARMADFIEDSIAVAMKPFSKLNQTTQLIDTELGEINGFLNDLQSPNNPSAQRIVGFFVDPVNGQTASLTAQGITVFLISVQLLHSQDNLVLQTNIGFGVVQTTVVSGQQ
jgi:hypothetical protein